MQVAESITGRLFQTAVETVRAARATSTTVELGRRVTIAVRKARCCRWLRTNPGPSIVAIDLRETRTVGRGLALVARLGLAQSRDHRSDAVLNSLRTGASGSRTARVLGLDREPDDEPSSDDERA